MDNRASLYKKILATQKSLEPLEKSGRNDYFKYSYTTAGDVLLPVQRACNEHGLIIMSDVIESKIEPGHALVIVRVTVADSETGESLSVSAPGYAEDKNDKAVYKAITGGTKYAVRSLFCLPSEDDPERQERQANTTSIPTNGSSGKPTKPPTTNSNLTVHSLQSDQSEATNKPVTGNSGSPTPLEQTTVEMERIGWTAIEGRQYLEQHFGKRGRKELTAEELKQFWEHLRSLPTAPALTPSLMAS